VRAPARPTSLLQRAIALLARRDHSRAELARKLQAQVAPEDDAAELDRVLDRLQADGKLSDGRFAASFVRQRAERFGATRIRHDLRARGVSAELSTQLTQDLRTQEADRLRALWSKRFGHAPADARQWAKQARFLAQRGFSTEAIRALLRDPPLAEQPPEPDGDAPLPGCAAAPTPRGNTR